MKKKILSNKEFNYIYSRVPRAAVDLIIVKEKKILLTKRSITPFKGMWHLSGGGVFFKEKVEDAINRIAKTELGIRVKNKRFVGYIDCLRDGKYRHTISFEFRCQIAGNKEPMALEQASGLKFFNKIPDNTISQQKEFLKRNWKKILR